MAHTAHGEGFCLKVLHVTTTRISLAKAHHMTMPLEMSEVHVHIAQRWRKEISEDSSEDHNATSLSFLMIVTLQDNQKLVIWKDQAVSPQLVCIVANATHRAFDLGKKSLLGKEFTQPLHHYCYKSNFVPQMKSF